MDVWCFLERKTVQHRIANKTIGDVMRKYCRLLMCMTELHGGVCHRTSTPHKSGNKMKEKKKKKMRKYRLR